MERIKSAPPTKEDFLSAMRGVPNCVTIVSTLNKGARGAATVSAFTSVSADPPTILVCMNTASRTADMVIKNQKFCINVLNQDNIFLAKRFAGLHDHEIKNRFEGIDFEDIPNYGLHFKDASLLICEITHNIISGSHHIFIAEVVGIKENQQNKQNALAYFDGSFAKISKLNP